MTTNDQSTSKLDLSVDPTYACVKFVNPTLAYASHDGTQEIYVSNDVNQDGWPLDFRYLLGYPAMAVFNGVLYLTHQSGTGDHQLFYTRYDGTNMSSGSTNWSLGVPIPHVYLNESPGMAVFKDKLYVAHQGSDTTDAKHSLWYTTFDGNTWSKDNNIPGVLMNGSPSLVVLGDTLYLFHQGADSTAETHSLWYTTTSDGITWTADKNIPNVSMDNSPSAIVVRSTELYVAYKTAGAGSIGTVINKGSGWLSLPTPPSNTPIYETASPTLYGDPDDSPDNVMLIYCDPNGGKVIDWPYI